MRESLTILACAVIALLTAALVGPWFVDWTAQRAFIEASLSRAVGAAVMTRGAIDLKLLPTPYLSLGGFDIVAPGLAVAAGKTRFEMAVMPLLRGEFRFYNAEIDAPDIALRLAAIAPPAAAAAASFERVRINNARLRLLDEAGAQRAMAEGVDFDGEAASLTGPFKGAGEFRWQAQAVPFRLVTGALENGRMRLKLISDEAAGLPRGDFDGALAFEPGGPALDGQIIVAGSTPAPWRLAGPLRVDVAGAVVDKLDARLGPDEAAIPAQGAASIDFGDPPRGKIALTARQLDLDRLIASPAFAMARQWLGEAGLAARLPFPLELSLTSPAAMLGNEPLSDLSARATLEHGKPIALELAAGAIPGGARLSMRGALETGAAAAFSGALAASARDLPRLADWIAQAAPDDAAKLRALPVRSLDVAGDLSLSAAGFSARGLTIKADRSTMTGAAAYTRAVGGARARLYADIASPAFDLDAAPDLTGAASALADVDLSIAIDARAIRLARFGEGAIDAGRIRLKLRREGEALTLEDLSIADLGGASLRANGSADARAGLLDGSVSAERLGDLAAFLRRVAPGALSDALAARATALSPARLAFRINASRPAPDQPLSPTALLIDGSARGVAIKASARPEGAGLAGTLTLESPDAAIFARQIGLAAAPTPGIGGARLDLSARGSAGEGYAIDAETKIAGAALTFHGRTEGAASASGDLSFKAANAAPLLRLAGFGLPDATARPQVEIQARAQFAPGALKLEGIAGSINGGAVAGELSIAPDAAARVQISGGLRLDRLNLASLAELALGPARALKPGESLSATPFAAGMARAPRVDLALQAAEWTLGGALSGGNARLAFALAPDVARFDGFEADFGEGKLAGDLTLRRDGAGASLIGQARLDDIAFARPGASGILSGAMDFSATGASMASLAAGLAGQGKARIRGLTIPRADADAPARVVAQTDSGGLFVGENDFLGALRRELGLAPLNAGDVSFEAAAAAGVVRLTSPGGLSLSYDARSRALETRAPLTLRNPPKDWDGPAPKLAVIWKDGKQEIDAGAFISALTARALMREQARIDAYEADARERAAFNRRRKGFDFLRLREREIAAFEAEQARIAADAERQRAIEAERQRAIEAERQRAIEAAPAKIAPAPRIAPVVQTPPPEFHAPAAGVDPSAAGRY